MSLDVTGHLIPSTYPQKRQNDTSSNVIDTPQHSQDAFEGLRQIICITLAKILAIFFPVLLALLALSYSAFGSTPPKFPDLLEACTEELVGGLQSGAFTSVDLTKAYVQRIQEVNPDLHAVTEINPDALDIAAALDAERVNGIVRSTLHGIPILIKDNIATMDKMSNTAGSYALLGVKVPYDSGVAAKLRSAGVVLLGKSSVSEWANFRSRNSSNGWSARVGQVTGAYYPNMDPSGSSSDSGVASSIGLALASLGTETSGSILAPASVNNVVGIKPTVGLTSRSLVIPISERQDTVGPMARTVSDAAYVLSIIAGKDENDNYTTAQPWDNPPDYTRALNFSSFNGTRIGIPRNGLYDHGVNKPVLDAFEVSIQVMRDAGAIIIENSNFSFYDEYAVDSVNPQGNISTVLCADFVSNLASYLSKLTFNPNNITNLADVFNFTRNSSLEEWSKRDTEIWEQALSLGFNNTSFQFWKMYQYTSYLGGEGGVTGVLKSYNVDALILPTDFSYRLPALAGLPVVSVPMGFYPQNTTTITTSWGLVNIGSNVPFGISFLDPKWSEELLIGLAYAYEQRTNIRQKVKPYILPKTQISDVITR